MGVRPAHYDLDIYQGATFRWHFTWRDPLTKLPINLTGFKARMQARLRIDSPDPPLITMTTEDGHIVLGAGVPNFRAVMSAEETKALNFDKAPYDLELQAPDGTVTRLFAAQVRLHPEVTR